MPRDILDKDETHTFHNTYCGHCGFGHCVGTMNSGQAVNGKLIQLGHREVLSVRPHGLNSVLKSLQGQLELLKMNKDRQLPKTLL